MDGIDNYGNEGGSDSSGNGGGDGSDYDIDVGGGGGGGDVDFIIWGCWSIMAKKAVFIMVRMMPLVIETVMLAGAMTDTMLSIWDY